MSHKEVPKLGEIHIEKYNFYTSEELININDVNIGNILVSHKHSGRKKCFKYFVGYANYFDDDGDQ